MKETYEVLRTERYPISVKRYVPETPVRGVVLGVHGFAGDKESSALRMLAETCAPKGVAVVAFDFPAHGASEANGDALTVENCAADLLAVADLCRMAYPDAKKYLFATSFGGYVTLLCGESLPEFGLVLRAPAVTMAEHILTDVLGVTPEEFRARGTVECGFERRIDLPYAFYESLQRNRLRDRETERDRGRVMTIVHGDRDDVVPPADVAAFCETHPCARLFFIPGADHRFKNPGELEAVFEIAMKCWGI